MSYNLAYAYVRTVLQERGPLTAGEIANILTQFPAADLDRVLHLAVDHGRLTVDHEGLHHVTADGAR